MCANADRSLVFEHMSVRSECTCVLLERACKRVRVCMRVQSYFFSKYSDVP